MKIMFSLRVSSMLYTNQTWLFYSQYSYSTLLDSVVVKISLWYSQNQMFS